MTLLGDGSISPYTGGHVWWPLRSCLWVGTGPVPAAAGCEHACAECPSVCPGMSTHRLPARPAGRHHLLHKAADAS